MEDVEEEEDELDLDLGFFVFFDFLDLECFLALFFDIFAGTAAIGTDPRDPPKGNTGPRAGIRGVKALAVS